MKAHGLPRKILPRKIMAAKILAPKILALCLLALGSAALSPAHAEDYPTRAVKIISDSAPGSAIDVTFRMVMDRLSRLWGQQAVPLNQPGASGALAARAAADAPPDGYTLFAPALSVFLAVPGKAVNLPVMLPRDFLPVGSISEQPMFIAASPASGIKSLADLIAAAKQHPGELSYAATGVGRITHLTSELLQSRTGIKLLLVPYTGGPTSALNDVLGGRIPLIIEGYSGLAGAIQAGSLKALAVGSAHRLPDFPDLPTVAETLPGFVAGGWQGIVATLGTPEAIVNKVSDDLRKVLGDPEIKKQLSIRGSYANPMSPSELTTFINAQQTQWRPVLEAFAAQTK
jgi:tripartite-type tricarboxylate transporter receptor subunit TctC